MTVPLVRSGTLPGRAAFGRILVFGALFIAVQIAGVLVLPLFVSAPADSLVIGSAVTLLAAWAGGAILIRRLDRRPVAALGLPLSRETPRDAGIGLVFGVASIGVAAIAMVAVGALRYAAEPGSALSWIGATAGAFWLLAVPAAAEEVLFRGYPFQVLVRAAGAVPATLIGSTLFALAHLQNPNVTAISVINIFLAGVLLSAAYLRTRSLWFATGLHLGWNWCMAAVLELPVSGLDFISTPLYEPVLRGPVWLTGGEFGPEGGLAATLAFGLALVAVRRVPGLDESGAMRRLRPLVDPDET